MRSHPRRVCRLGVLILLGGLVAARPSALASAAQTGAPQTAQPPTTQGPGSQAPGTQPPQKQAPPAAPVPPAASETKPNTPSPASKPAALAVDTPQQVLLMEQCVPLRPRKVFAAVWRRLVCDPPRALGQFSERVFDRNHLPLERVSARIDAITKSPAGFDPNRSLTFTFDDRPVDLFSGANADARRVDADSQANVRGTVTNLDVGEYNVTIRVVASNSADNDAERVILSMFVKDEPWLPLIVVLLGVFLSFLTKKIFVVTKDRLALRGRIAQMNSSWLRNEPASSAVVWAQANLRLAGSLARQSWLTVPDLVNTRLAEVEALLPTLRAIRDMRASLQSNVTNALALTRSLGKLVALTARCSNPPLTAAITQQIEAELAVMDVWSRSDQLATALWKDRQDAIQKLLSNIQTSRIVDPAAKTTVDGMVKDLKDALDAAQPPDNVFSLYEEYAALEVLWQRRNEPGLLVKLATAYQARHSVEELFAISDADAWDNLKRAAADDRIRIVAPAVPQQVFDPFTLRVTAGDQAIDESYLFKFRLRYRWHFKLISRRWWAPWAGETKVVELTPETLEPAVVQYLPRPGTVSATVTIWNGTSDSVPIEKRASFKIERSDAVPLVGAMERAGIWPLVAAAIVAVLTGLSTQYFGNTTFGSPKDYLTLFLTGAAVDWVKNAVQPTASSTAPPATAPPPPAK